MNVPARVPRVPREAKAKVPKAPSAKKAKRPRRRKRENPKRCDVIVVIECCKVNVARDKVFPERGPRPL